MGKRVWSSFEALRVLPQAATSAIVNRSVKDIDLYPAGIAKASVNGGDRFWYENDHPLPSRLTDDQLNAIRQTTFASVLCSNVAGIKSIQASVFRTVSDSNSRLSCSDIRPMDLGPWLSA
ncbi:hypothetical protein BV898_17432 [Hypsibius exemplaris]|uniref:Uncharacterized protein n=1 Tax=Hypsibius exemplaris TaxID=2072580 RepID=A0A9X6NGV2_HYPEX|nr:hypothetical protein BV898_17432 [Hypsibius exemplaris]